MSFYPTFGEPIRKRKIDGLLGVTVLDGLARSKGDEMNGWRIQVLFKCEEWGIAVDGGTYSAQRAFGVLPHVSGCHCACSACDSAGAPDPRCNELWDRLDSAGLRPPTLARPALVRRSGATDERLVARLAEYLPPGPALS